MTVMNPYLTFRETCEEAFEFYKSVFGGEFLTLSRFSDAPPEMSVPEADKNKIMHVSLPVGEHTILMGSDKPAAFGSVEAGNNFSISLSPDSREATDTLFNALSAGGHVTMPLAETFWGAYFGMLVDKFGIQWMLNHDLSRNG